LLQGLDPGIDVVNWQARAVVHRSCLDLFARQGGIAG